MPDDNVDEPLETMTGPDSSVEGEARARIKRLYWDCLEALAHMAVLAVLLLGHLGLTWLGENFFLLGFPKMFGVLHTATAGVFSIIYADQLFELITIFLPGLQPRRLATLKSRSERGDES